MINKVIICGVRRAKQLIPKSQIKQAIGRAGRSYQQQGTAIIICNNQDKEYAKSCFQEQSQPILSELDNIKEISFQILPWINQIYDQETFQKWFSKTLAFIQGKNIHWNDISKYLLENSCIDEEYNITEIGKISILMYYPIDKLLLMRQRLLQAYSNGNICQNLTISYMLANENLYLPDFKCYEFFQYKKQLSSNGYELDNKQLMHGFILYSLLNNHIPKQLKSIASLYKTDLQRLFNVLILLIKEQGYNQFVEELNINLISALKKVNYEIASIIYYFKLSKKSFGYELYNMNIFNVDDLNNNEYELLKDGSQQLKIQLQQNGFLKDRLVKEWKYFNK